MLGSLCQAAYGIGFLINSLWAATCMKLLSLAPFNVGTYEGICLGTIQLAWRISQFSAPWMRCSADADTASEWESIQRAMAAADAEAVAEKKPYRPLMILGNHASFFDTILSVVAFPASVLCRCRTYMAGHLFKLPILATICRSVGHFPVYFTSDADGVFKVDKEKNELVDKKVNAHLDKGGWLCFFPEGQMNKNPDQILPFRYGGLKKALDYDASIAFFVSCGNTEVWPKKCKVGGFPGRVRYSFKSIAPDGAKAFVKKLRAQANLSEEDAKSEDHVLLGKHLHTLMQKQYDDLKAALTGGEKSKSD